MGKDKNSGIEMKNPMKSNIPHLFETKTAGETITADENKSTFPHEDLEKETTLEVKEHGGSLLIILPEVSSRPAEQGNTLPPLVSYVFPFPYRSSKKILHVRYSKSYQMSTS
jgi:hypothetical protein